MTVASDVKQMGAHPISTLKKLWHVVAPAAFVVGVLSLGGVLAAGGYTAALANVKVGAAAAASLTQSTLTAGAALAGKGLAAVGPVAGLS